MMDNNKFYDEVGKGLTLTTYSQHYIITDGNETRKPIYICMIINT